VFSWTQALVLALIQGLSEFLPISSSAHLVLPSQLLGWQDQGLLFDVAVHLGTLLAVVSYFWRDLISLVGDLFPSLRQSFAGFEGELGCIVIATLPATVVGFGFGAIIEQHSRTLAVIAFTTLVFGLLLGVASWLNTLVYPNQADREVVQQVHWRHALVIGVAQIFALIPGTSRSGVTITAGLLLGYTPAAAARFSFLMSVPIILGALVFLLFDALGDSAVSIEWGMMLGAAAVAGISAYLTIAVFLGVVARMGMMPFVWYRLILGTVLVLMIL
jgi:undecaprenyl-diphosphatase